MKCKLRYSVSKQVLLTMAITLALLGSHPAMAQETVLHRFQGKGQDGNNPFAGLIFDNTGNAFGTAVYGGSGTCTNGIGSGCGTVFELSPQSGGGWAETVLYSFQVGQDGRNPSGRLVFDAMGNLYGTTYSGGNGGYGTVFALSPESGGGWIEKVLYSFQGEPDGVNPQAGLTFDAGGNLYGTTYTGGTSGHGAIFEVSPQSGGGWTEKALYSFQGEPDGANPWGGLIFDSAGNLYGTVQSGGVNGAGIVFELSPQSGGGWSETILHRFRADLKEGYWPFDSLVFSTAGNLYGTTAQGGTANCYGEFGPGCGTVFELGPKSGGGWAFRVVHDFQGYPLDGDFPYAGLVRDFNGNLLGVTEKGGQGGAGTVFEINPRTGAERLVHSFDGRTGSQPISDLLFDTSGNLYGTTYFGGSTNGCSGGCGVVFEITP